jgi:hypothetical protein
VNDDDLREALVAAAYLEGDVFAVTGWDEQTIVAVAGEQATPGLVFYDLKQCLKRLADEA